MWCNFTIRLLMRSMMIPLFVGVIVVFIIRIWPFHQTTDTEIKLFCQRNDETNEIHD